MGLGGYDCMAKCLIGFNLVIPSAIHARLPQATHRLHAATLETVPLSSDKRLAKVRRRFAAARWAHWRVNPDCVCSRIGRQSG